MGKSLNEVKLIGNVGQDPDARSTAQGKNVTTVSVATSQSWKDPQTGQQQERTEWHRVVFWERVAEIAAQYIRKGSRIYVCGELRTRKYQDSQTGQDRYSTEIVGKDLILLDGKPENGAARSAPAQAPAAPAPGNQESFDDDIPF